MSSPVTENSEVRLSSRALGLGHGLAEGKEIGTAGTCGYWAPLCGRGWPPDLLFPRIPPLGLPQPFLPRGLCSPCSLVTQLCLTLCNPMDCSLPGSSLHGISQAKILEWVDIAFSRGLSQPRGWNHVSCIGRWVLSHWATREAPCFMAFELRTIYLSPGSLPEVFLPLWVPLPSRGSLLMLPLLSSSSVIFPVLGGFQGAWNHIISRIVLVCTSGTGKICQKNEQIQLFEHLSWIRLWCFKAE